MTPDELAQIFLSIPPHEPLAVTLLRERRAATGELFPTQGDNKIRLVRATRELHEIAVEAQRMIGDLSSLQPVPTTDTRAESIIGGYCL
jgi:hypothetical protein